MTDAFRCSRRSDRSHGPKPALNAPPPSRAAGRIVGAALPSKLSRPPLLPRLAQCGSRRPRQRFEVSVVDIGRDSGDDLRPDQIAPHASDGVAPVPGWYALTPAVQATAAKLEC